MTKQQLLEQYWELRDLYLQLEDPLIGKSVVNSWGSPEFVDTVADAAVVRTEIKKRMDYISREINKEYNRERDSQDREP